VPDIGSNIIAAQTSKVT